MAAGPPLFIPLILAAFGYLALYQGIVDAALLVGLCAVRGGPLIRELIRPQFLGYFWRVIGVITIVSGLRGVTRLFRAQPQQPVHDGFGKVLFFPCRTTHARLFPKKHSFSHSYLVVGIPVGWEGTAGGLVSSGIQEQNDGLLSWLSLGLTSKKAWYDVNAADYLERGRGHLGLRGKLDEFLKTQGINPADLPHAYIVTAARFLGYHFNPVSFWYLYDSDRRLSSMILEVNNTFGERHMYFLAPGNEDSADRITAAPTSTAYTSRNPPARKVIKGAWSKDFHVSPFNSRNGSYSLAAGDILGPCQPGARQIDNNITLKSSKGPGKIVARLFSEGPPIDPTALSGLQKLAFLASWWWVGLVTFPRIVKEAWVLFFRRHLHVWYRPEPLKESMGRMADASERQLESVFRRYLRHLVEASELKVEVKYIAGGLSADTEEIMRPSSVVRGSSSDTQMLEFKVLTPVFYSRFVYYAHDLEAIFCEFRENGTVWVSRPELVPTLFLKPLSPPLESSSYADYAYFKAIQWLRRRPERIERPLTSSATPATRPQEKDIRDFRISSMDGYVLAKEENEGKKMYRDTVVKLFIADRVAFGLVPLLEAQRFAVQLWLSWIISSTVSQTIKQGAFG